MGLKGDVEEMHGNLFSKLSLSTQGFLFPFLYPSGSASVERFHLLLQVYTLVNFLPFAGCRTQGRLHKE